MAYYRHMYPQPPCWRSWRPRHLWFHLRAPSVAWVMCPTLLRQEVLNFSTHTYTHMHGCVSNIWEASPTEPATPEVHGHRDSLTRMDTTQLENANQSTPAAAIHALVWCDRCMLFCACCMLFSNTVCGVQNRYWSGTHTTQWRPLGRWCRTPEADGKERIYEVQQEPDKFLACTYINNLAHGTP